MHTSHRGKTLAALSLAALVALTGCSAAPTATTPAASASQAGDVLAAVGLAGLTGREIVETLDQDPTARPLPLTASVRYDEVIVGDGTAEVSVPIDGDQFYLSVAPYATQSHECYFHSLATCRGELAGTDVAVRIVDDAGTVLVDETTTTYANGFVGFWLPRDISGTVTMTVDGTTGSVPFATGPDDATCLTTLQLT